MMENSQSQQNLKAQLNIKKMYQPNITKYFPIDLNRRLSSREQYYDSCQKVKMYLQSLDADYARQNRSKELELSFDSTMSSHNIYANASDTDPSSSKTMSIGHSLDNNCSVKHISDMLPQYRNLDYVSNHSDEINTNQEHSTRNVVIGHGSFTYSSYASNNEPGMAIKDPTTSGRKKGHGPFCKCKTERRSRYQNDSYLPDADGGTSDSYSKMIIKGRTTSLEKEKYEPLPAIQQLTQYEKDNSSHTSDNEPDITRTLSTTTFGKENVIPRTRRAPNEIRSASMICPILIRDPAKQGLIRTLIQMGIYSNYYPYEYGFDVALAEIGEDLAKKYVSDAEKNSLTSCLLRVCMYCGFKTESRLALGYHMDTKHKNKFKIWPYAQRMDFVNDSFDRTKKNG